MVCWMRSHTLNAESRFLRRARNRKGSDRPQEPDLAPTMYSSSRRRGNLVLRLCIEVARLVPLVQLARWVAIDAVHHPPTPHRLSLGDRIGPALDVLVLGHL